MGLIKFLKDKFKNKKNEAVHEKYIAGMDKSHNNFSSKLKKLEKKYMEINSEYFDDLEEILIEADVGVKLTAEILNETEKEAALKHLEKPEQINDLLIDKMFTSYINSGDNIQTDIKFSHTGPTVLLMVGVNGSGKTTTIAKLTHRYLKKGKRIILVAGDTFRAAATEQLEVWAQRLNVPIIKGKENGDPASVIYEGVKKASEENYDLVIVDTAGRLQNKVYLMDELKKIKRVIQKIIPDAPHEVFLVIDANTGQNGVVQAKVFKECTDLTGVIITKMDGTGKGGIILSIRDELGVPVRFIGLGEQFEDLIEFDLDNYLYGLLLGGE